VNSTCLHFVHKFVRGELAQPFQSFHVHFFSWLGAVSENEVTQAMAARVVMLLLLLGTGIFLFLLGTHLLGPLGALFSVLCYLSLSYRTKRRDVSHGHTRHVSFACLVPVRRRKESIVAGIAAGSPRVMPVHDQRSLL
jgi:hypothetical protein